MDSLVANSTIGMTMTLMITSTMKIDATTSSSDDDNVIGMISSERGGEGQVTEASAVIISKDIVFFSLAVIIPCGLLFNMLSFAIYMRRQMRKRATSLYFAALAASDSLSLIAIAFDYWLKVSFIGQLTSK